jgi:DNA-binding response OmpR family regulator
MRYRYQPGPKPRVKVGWEIAESASSAPGDTVAPVRILVVDDEVDLAEAIGRGLRREGYAVDLAFDGEEALEKAAVNAYDLICLDVTMPRMDGLEVCQRLRDEPHHGEAPRVLMLTARDSIDDRILGLDSGADDYLVKPFAFGELAARVRSLLRRDASKGTSVLRVGPLELDAARHSARRAERELDLTAKEFALLRYFMAHPGEVVSQEELLEHVWDEHADPFTNTVRVTVGTLRRKVTIDDEEALIETVIGRGYRLRDDVAVLAVGSDA